MDLYIGIEWGVTMKCQGECSEQDKCVGEVKKVRVVEGLKDWGKFYYCDYAIQTDRDNGFTVMILE